MIDVDSDLYMNAIYNKKLQSELFIEQVAKVIDELDDNPGKSYSLAALYNAHSISRRRFYDVVNVLTAIGCCKRMEDNKIKWIGTWNIESELVQMKTRSGIENEKLVMGELFNVENCICLMKITMTFLALFATIEADTIDLREAAAFFSRGTWRYKSTLCKLYQITPVLGALRILEKTSTECAVRLLSPYKEMIQIKYQSKPESPYSISYLLNNVCKSYADLAKRREKEYHDISFKANFENYGNHGK